MRVILRLPVKRRRALLTSNPDQGIAGRALESAATNKNDIAFTDTLRRLVAALHDGHGNVVKSSQRAALPLSWDWIEGKLVITAVAPAVSARISAGDAVLKINGRNAGEALADREALISGATPQWIRYRALQDLARGNEGENVNLEIEPFQCVQEDDRNLASIRN
ncbi:MAG: hypothetical protein DMG57_05275 [Acidobacteria bacterium]|nr:MAG: hypothetical protein DMG57_05275 [Acidobacteriota bacterium]